MAETFLSHLFFLQAKQRRPQNFIKPIEDGTKRCLIFYFHGDFIPHEKFIAILLDKHFFVDQLLAENHPQNDEIYF